MVVDEFLEQGKPKYLLLKHVGLPRSSYYYTSTGTKAGKRPANCVYDNEGSSYDLKYVTEKISELLSGEFVDYGYYKTYRYLNDELAIYNLIQKYPNVDYLTNIRYIKTYDNTFFGFKKVYKTLISHSKVIFIFKEKYSNDKHKFYLVKKIFKLY